MNHHKYRWLSDFLGCVSTDETGLWGPFGPQKDFQTIADDRNQHHGRQFWQVQVRNSRENVDRSRQNMANNFATYREMIWYNWLISRSHSLDQHHIHGGTTEIEHKRTNKWHETFWWISFFKCFGYLSQWLPSFDGPVGSVRWTNKLDG